MKTNLNPKHILQQKMASTANDLCRLCAKKHDFLKDLLDENNKSILDLIKNFTQINVVECDNMPTKVCIDCEERIVSFQLYILECYKVQDALRKMCIDTCDNFIKTETEIQFNLPCIKAEEPQVKDELTAEDIVSAITNQTEISDYEEDEFQNEDINQDLEDDQVASQEDSDVDDITIASLIEQGKLKSKNIELPENKAAELKDVLNKPIIKVKDLVKLKCLICEQLFKTWSSLSGHYYKSHKSKVVVYCLCGYAIHSKTVLYKHVSDHKRQTKKRMNSEQSDQDSSSYMSLKIKDFINFNCPECRKPCTSWYNLKAHCERRHTIAPVVQCSCGITLKSKSVMYKHVQDHRNPNNDLSCDQCAKIMKSEAALEKHKMKHIPKTDRKFRCSSCDKVFLCKEGLKSHEKSHIPIEDRKVYRCDICDLRFTTKSSAASHKRVVHDKIKSYVCDLCGYACGTNGELRQHRAIHSNEKPFVCKKCSKPFKTYSNLKTHMDTHEDTSYACYVCNRVLNSRRTLRKHLLVHEDKCRHQCPYCSKAFKRRQTLKVHLYTHTGDKPLSCKWCDERFSYASTLRSHRLRCHPDKMAAQACSNYTNYTQMTSQEDYIKSDLAAIGITKNEVEAVQ
ncbi:zinc finger protein 660-like isoform X2 [Hyposmocoma kahamanoa]|uniref:zinc finger protein 660-like isoform X2 n=1 Tax=Hyposmocoma kahamanoa TaxID=1477025 RepID=UPI000E6D8388|nr:zinc finger protein 660-like isoform X2 [Hyposmocoma kahamanoa]